MGDRPRRWQVPIAVLAAAGLVALSAGPATAADDPGPLDGLGEQVQQQLEQGQQQLQEQLAQLTGGAQQSEDGDGSGGTASDLPKPSSDDDSAGHETTDPKGPDHADGSVAHVQAGDTDVAQIGGNKATVQDDDSTKADSTILALGGQEVAGSHADSDKTGENSFGDPLAPLCEQSGGQVCLQVLYAETSASDADGTSSASSRSGLAKACVGGSSTDPDAECDGPVALGAVSSSAWSERDQRTGRTTAGSMAQIADLCLQRTATGCALAVGALHSEGSADSHNSPGTAERDSYLLDLSANGEDQARVEDPTSIAVPPDCATPALVCAFLNQGETYLGDGLAGTAQDALVAALLPDQGVLGLTAGHTETLVHNDGGMTPGAAGDQPGASGGGPGVAEVSDSGTAGAGTGSFSDAAGGLLPNTGGPWSGLLAGGLLALGSGAALLARHRRRMHTV